MHKRDLIEILIKKTDLTRNESFAVANLFFDEIANALTNGDRVEIRGFCSFHVKEYQEYTGRNPKTGEKIKVGRKKLPFFRCGQELMDRVDRKKFLRQRRKP